MKIRIVEAHLAAFEAASQPKALPRPIRKRSGRRRTQSKAIPKAKRTIEQLKADAAATSQKFLNLRKQFDALHTKYKQGKATQSDVQQLQLMQHQIMAFGPPTQTLQSLAGTDFGPGAHFLPAVDMGCVRSGVFSDKQVRGGSTTVVPKRYVFEFCPFRNVTQMEYKHDLWNAVEEDSMTPTPAMLQAQVDGQVQVQSDGSQGGAEGGDAQVGTAAAMASRQLDADGVFEDRAAGQALVVQDIDLSSPVLLGSWEGWAAAGPDMPAWLAEEPELQGTSGPSAGASFPGQYRLHPDPLRLRRLPRAGGSGAMFERLHQGDIVMLFEGGAQCADGGPRTVLARGACGAEAVRDVVEDGVCRYMMQVHHPIFCHPQLKVALRKQLVALQVDLSKLEAPHGE